MATTARKTSPKQTKSVDSAVSTDKTFTKEYLVSIDDSGLIPAEILSRQTNDVKQSATQQGLSVTGDVKLLSETVAGPRSVSLKYSVTVK